MPSISTVSTNPTLLLDCVMSDSQLLKFRMEDMSFLELVFSMT